MFFVNVLNCAPDPEADPPGLAVVVSVVPTDVGPLNMGPSLLVAEIEEAELESPQTGVEVIVVVDVGVVAAVVEVGINFVAADAVVEVGVVVADMVWCSVKRGLGEYRS